MTARTLRHHLVGGLALLAIAAPCSQAATVDVVAAGGSEAVRYVAAPGERNDLSFTEIEDSWPSAFLVSDPGASVTTGPGCVSVDTHSAACVARSGAMYNLRARLGDGDDVLHPAGSNNLRANGGPGNDRLVGGASEDQLDGGGGTDELHGADGGDTLLDGDRDDDGSGGAPDADILDGGPGDDWASYEQRSEPVAVDLSDTGADGAAGEGDVLTGIENLHGGRGNDRLTGDNRANAFTDEGGDNEFFGKAGDDYFGAARSGRVECGSGNDRVRGVTRNTLVLASCETLLRAPVEWDADFVVRAYPRRTARGMSLAMECGSSDGEPIPCAGKVTIEARSRTLASGAIRRGTDRRTARLTLTPAGSRLLARRTVTATVKLRGSGLPNMAWRITLVRRR